jgi:hypothetical protein
VTVIRQANSLVEWLVVDVIDPAAADASGRDRRGIAAGEQAGYEIAAVLPTGDTRKRAVLALQKATRVRHDGHQDAGLTGGEAERTYRLDADRPRAVVDGAPLLVAHRSRSSARRGCGVDRPPPPVRTP